MTRTLLAVAVFIAATASFAILQKAAAQDVEKGQRSFNKCLPCHAIGPAAENKVGPELNGLDGRQAGTAANFNYSDANKNSGLVWNEATFKDYIRSPLAKIPGTKMAFAGRNAAHFGRWLGARSDVIYTIMSDEQRRPAVERPASLRVAAKIAAGFVEELDRMADTLFALLLPGARLWLQRGSRK